MLKKIKSISKGDGKKKEVKKHEHEKEGKSHGFLHNLKKVASHHHPQSASSNRVDLEGKTLELDDRVRIVVGKKIAEGGFAFVYLAKDVESKQQYALKRIYIADSQDLPQAQRELEILQSLPPHKNIVPFITGKMTNNHETSDICLDILMGFASGGIFIYIFYLYFVIYIFIYYLILFISFVIIKFLIII